MLNVRLLPLVFITVKGQHQCYFVRKVDISVSIFDLNAFNSREGGSVAQCSLGVWLVWDQSIGETIGLSVTTTCSVSIS